MSWASDFAEKIFGGGNKTQQTTQTTSNQPWVDEAQKFGYATTLAMVSPFLKPPKEQIAGFTPDQMQGFGLTRDLAQSAFTGTPVRGIPQNPTLANLMNATTTMANAAQVGGNDIQSRMNPYLNSVLNPTLDAMRRERNNSAAAIGARAGSGQAFGGSGEAIQRALLDRSYLESVASTVGQTMAQGWNAASGLADADAARRQQVNLTNAGASNNTSQFNADLNSATSRFNATAANDFALRAPTIEDGLKNNDQERKIAALQMLLGTGSTQQQLAQKSLDLPLTNLQRLLAATPGGLSQTTTTTSPDNSPSTLQQLLAIGLTSL